MIAFPSLHVVCLAKGRERVAKGPHSFHRIDGLGRVVIPVEIRDLLEWKPGLLLQVIATPEGVLYREWDGLCRVCRQETGPFQSIKGFLVCEDCIQHIKDTTDNVTPNLLHKLTIQLPP